MKYSTLLLLFMLGRAEARTLGNQTLEQAFERSTAVAYVEIVEARLLTIPDQHEVNEATPTNCGTNVRARVIEPFKGVSGPELEFAIQGPAVVGEKFLGFFQKVDTNAWYQSEWLSFFSDSKVSEAEFLCLEGVFELKASAFPQRLIPLNHEGYLDVELNNIIFPIETIKAVEEPVSVIAQYTKKRVDYSKLRPFLLDLRIKTENEQLTGK